LFSRRRGSRFVVVSLLTIVLHRREMGARLGKPLAATWHRPFAAGLSRLRTPAVALAGAMALVGLLTVRTTPRASSLAGASDGEYDDDGARSDAPVDIVGHNLSRWLGRGYDYGVVAPLGALGAFFSGSTTVSNLTFGTIQLGAAGETGASRTAILALQVGAHPGEGQGRERGGVGLAARPRHARNTAAVCVRLQI
jgi:L-lactate permease